MAFSTDTDLQNGLRAGYWKLTSWQVDMLTGEASATFHVFAARQHAGRGGRPASDRIARLDLQGDDFEQWFGEGRDENLTDQAIFYRAAKEIGVNSDFGGDAEPSDKTTRRGHRPLFKRARAIVDDGDAKRRK